MFEIVEGLSSSRRCMQVVLPLAVSELATRLHLHGRAGASLPVLHDGIVHLGVHLLNQGLLLLHAEQSIVDALSQLLELLFREDGRLGC